MFRLAGSLWLLAALIATTSGQFPCPQGMPASVCSSIQSQISAASTASSTTDANSASKTGSSATDTAASITSSQTTATASSGSTNSANGGEGSSAVLTTSGGPAATGVASDEDSSSSGMSSGEKIGIGVGVGVGVAAIAAIGAFFLIARRRKIAQPGPGSSRPPMSSGTAPVLAGAVAASRSRSPSIYTEPDAPSNYSRQSAMIEQEPLDATNIATSRSRTPPRLSIPTTPEQEAVFPEQKAYFEHGRPSPMSSGVARAVSPASDFSPVDSGPPSPFKGFYKV